MVEMDASFNDSTYLNVLRVVLRRSAQMANVTKLRAEHASLAGLAKQLSALIAQRVPPSSQALYEIRMKLASGLIHHLKSEDWTLYPALLASSNESIALTARAFSASMGGLAGEFREYSDRWGADTIRGDWSGFQRETNEILRALKTRMLREERDLYPLISATEEEAA